jgi:hypothetical protein
MLKTTLLLFFVVVSLMHAQNEGAAAKDDKFYQLDFVVKEVENGKVTNNRAYSMITSPSGRGQIRVGSRLPVPTAGTAQASSFTYIDVGVSIDCGALRELQNQLAFRISADVGNAVKNEQTQALPPVIRQNKWDSQVIIPIKKPTLLFSSDDPVAKGKIQLEVTATRIE